MVTGRRKEKQLDKSNGYDHGSSTEEEGADSGNRTKKHVEKSQVCEDRGSRERGGRKGGTKYQ